VPTILLAQEDAEARDQLGRWILDFFPTANLRPVEAWENLPGALASPPPASVLLTEVFWQGENRAEELVLLAENFPQVFSILLSRFELQDCLPAGCPLPRLKPDESLPLRLAESMENLSGRILGPYTISAPAGPHLGGRLYWAKHEQLERSVQILVPPSGSTTFARTIRAMARISHPSVYSIYESFFWENRILVAVEPVLHPSLLHLRIAGETPPLPACARLAGALASVLAEMDSSSLPARRLGEYDYTLSPKGTPRLRNPAAEPGESGIPFQENARYFAEILDPWLGHQPKGRALLQILREAGDSPQELLRQTRDFERSLAEFRQVHVRKEELEAEAKTLRARQVRRWAIGIGAVLLAAFLAVYARVIFQAFFLDLPSRLSETELPVPGGSVDGAGETVEVKPFFLDRHEVTIGEYEKFLAAMRKDPAWQRFLPDAARVSKNSPADLEPRDWPEILRRARKHQPYQDQKINRDTPVFNVDYPSAAAYARWKGRRLPTMAEWIRAAGGDDHRRFPWGGPDRPIPANLGASRSEPMRRDSSDSFFNASPGESFPDDRGPYGHFDLGGNVSEWAVGPLQKPVAMGGNFTDPDPVSIAESRRQDGNRNDPPAQTQLEVIGFRTARD